MGERGVGGRRLIIIHPLLAYIFHDIERLPVAFGLNPDGEKGGIPVWRHWLSLLIGIWIFISPWVLDLTNRAAIVWNSVIVGIVVFILSLVDLSRGERGSP